jgi:hypothetical protein
VLQVSLAAQAVQLGRADQAVDRRAPRPAPGRPNAAAQTGSSAPKRYGLHRPGHGMPRRGWAFDALARRGRELGVPLNPDASQEPPSRAGWVGKEISSEQYSVSRKAALAERPTPHETASW